MLCCFQAVFGKKLRIRPQIQELAPSSVWEILDPPLRREGRVEQYIAMYSSPTRYFFKALSDKCVSNHKFNTNTE